MEHEVALVDDHHMVRNGIAAMVNGFGGYRVVLEAAHGRELIELLKDRVSPAIAIVDLNMPVMDGYETIAWLKEHRPEVLPLALTFDLADDAMVKAVRAGARGFLLKNARPQLLKTALDSLMLTGYHYTDDIHRTLQENPGMRTRQERLREEVLSAITPREMEFLMLVCSEDEPTYEQIGAHMGVHRRTVDGYRISLFDKFAIKSKTGLVLFALRWGLLER
jgi:two-component system, NarL family, invasion response regulator UvrY